MSVLLRSFLLLLPTAFATTCFAAIGISSTGDYSVNITAANLVSGAGSDLQSSQESASGVTTITISGASSQSWTVKVRRGTGTWNNNVTLFVQRTSSGSGPGTITGGTSYVSVGTIDTTFFTGSGNKSGISLQFKLVGFSKSIPPGTYSAPVTFSVL